MVILGVILIISGIIAMVLGCLLLANARAVADKVRPRSIGRGKRFRRFVAESMDLIAAGIIVAGLAVAIVGGLKVANEVHALPPAGTAVLEPTKSSG